ncbi:hypothetical protein Bbelb_417170 [Branchiostoma belcheri]|nr:hypothetical protein Bbelb_417170 [Branchiostoma belcheri]
MPPGDVTRGNDRFKHLLPAAIGPHSRHGTSAPLRQLYTLPPFSPGISLATRSSPPFASKKHCRLEQQILPGLFCPVGGKPELVVPFIGTYPILPTCDEAFLQHPTDVRAENYCATRRSTTSSKTLRSQRNDKHTWKPEKNL